MFTPIQFYNKILFVNLKNQLHFILFINISKYILNKLNLIDLIPLASIIYIDIDIDLEIVIIIVNSN